MKCIVLCGVLFGFRSLTEHLNLSPSDIKTGVYEDDHPFAGMEYVGIGGLVDKTNKLSVHNNYTRDTTHLMRIPLSKDRSCPGSSLLRMLEKSAPDQTRLYCYLDTKMGKCFPRKPIGRNTLSGFHKRAADILGIDQSDFTGGHAWRHVHCTINANNPNLNLREKMEGSRHSSVAAFLGYVAPDTNAEAERVMGILDATGNSGLVAGRPVVCNEKKACESVDDCESQYDDKKPSSTAELQQIQQQQVNNSFSGTSDEEWLDGDEEWLDDESINDEWINMQRVSGAAFMSPRHQARKRSLSGGGSDGNVSVGADSDCAFSYGFDDDVGGENETFLPGPSPVHDVGLASIGTQAQFELLEEELGEEGGANMYNHHCRALDRMKSNRLVDKARALVGGKLSGRNSCPQVSSRKRHMSENEKTIRNLRLKLKHEKRKRAAEKQQYWVNLNAAKKSSEALAKRVNDLENSFIGNM